MIKTDFHNFPKGIFSLSSNEERFISPSRLINALFAGLNDLFESLQQGQRSVRAKIQEIRSPSYALFIRLKVNEILGVFQRVFDTGSKIKNVNKRQAQSNHHPSPLPSKENSSLAKFRHAVRDLQKTIAIGSLVKNTVLLDKDYWMETLKLRLVIDNEIIEGHIYTGYLTGEKYFDKWKNERDVNRVLFHEQYSFEEYMNLIVLPRLTPEKRQEFKSKISIVEYYHQGELNSLEALFDADGRIYTRSSSLNDWVDHLATNKGTVDKYSDFYANRPPSALKERKDHLVKDQTYMYVLDHQGRLYLQIKNRGKTNHTSLSNGHAVLAAGSLQIQKGRIVSIDTFSGHYKPTEIQLANFFKYLKESGVPLDPIKTTYVGNYAIQPWQINEISPGEAENWLADRQI